jgi:hypothetical protein
VATTTGFIRPDSAAARQTHSTIGRPAIGRKTLRLSRVELSLAGITPAIRIVLMQESLQEKTELNRFPAGAQAVGTSIAPPQIRLSLRQNRLAADSAQFDLSSSPPYHLIQGSFIICGRRISSEPLVKADPCNPQVPGLLNRTTPAG